MSYVDVIVDFIVDNNRTGLKDFLSKSGPVDLEIQSERGVTLAHAAANLGRSEIVDILAKFGADLFARDENGLNVINKLALVIDSNLKENYSLSITAEANASMILLDALANLEKNEN